MKNSGFQIDPKRIRKLLIIRPRFIGDVLLSTPLVRALKSGIPRLKISYLAEEASLDVLKNNPYVDKLITLERGSLADDLLMIKNIRKRKFDAVIDTFGNPRTALLTYFSGAKYRIGWGHRGRKYAYTHFVGDGTGLSLDAIDEYNRAARIFGIESPAKETFLKLTNAERKFANEYFRGHGLCSGKSVIGLHPGASWPAKMWPPEKFAALADRFMANGFNVIVFSGPKDRVVGAKVIMLMKKKPVFADNLPLRAFSAVVSLLDGFISNDNGAMHVAAALKIPLAGIFGPGNPKVWFPYIKNAVWLQKIMPCWPCRKDHCEDMKCMRALNVEEVYAAFASISVRKKK